MPEQDKNTPLDIEHEVLAVLLSRDEFEVSENYSKCLPWCEHLEFLADITDDNDWKQVYVTAAKRSRAMARERAI